MSLYSSLTQVLAPFAAKINGLLTGWDGTKYSTPGEAVRQQIADLHVLIGDTPGTAIQASAVAYGNSDVGTELTNVNGRLTQLKDDLGYGEVITDVTIPDGYKTANYQNSAGTIKLFYANDVLTFLMKWTDSEATPSYGRLGINQSHVALTVNDTLRFRLRSVMDAELRYRTQATDNYNFFNLELRVYNADYSDYKSVYVPFPSGTETLNRLNLSDFVTDNEIDISVYYNLVIYGLYWTQHTTAAGETATLTIVGYGPSGGVVAENIVEKVERLENELDEQGETVDGFAADITANANRITTVENLLLMNESEPGAVVNLTAPNVGYVMDSGRLVSDSNYEYTDLIPVVGGAEYKFTAFIFGGVGLSWYDSTGTYISGVSGSTLGGTQFSALTFTLTAPDNAAYIRISHKVDASKAFTMQQLTDVDTSNIIERFSEKLGQLDTLPNLNDGEIYFACGDSITHANHNGVDKIDLTDPYMPSGGTEGYTYNTKNYAYYIARRHFLKWYNFGIGGTTLTECSVAGVDMKGFAAPNGRYTQLANGVTPDYITIFFGWNDKTQGPIQQREIWLENEYGSTIYYPQTASKIGTTGYATQAQYDACNAVTGEVGGVMYNNNAEYFFAKFIGTISDTDPKTWYGAWNTVLPYLIQKYPVAKIMPIVPYSSVQDENSVLGINLMMKQAVRNVAEKWGLAYFDFDSDEHQEFLATNTTPIGSYANIKAFRKAYLIADAVHPTNGGYKYMSNMIGSKLFAV